MHPHSAQSVFLALPGSPRGPEPKDRVFVRPVKRGTFRAAATRISSPELSFNKCWAHALNIPGLTHFAMQHDDVLAEPGWCDTLIDLMDAYRAAVCSAVVPIKDERGLTSTALRDIETGRTRRLTMAEVHRLPETFDADDVTELLYGRHRQHSEVLVVNTGLAVCRLTDRWCEHFGGFQSTHGVVKGPDGLWRAGMVSEDWAWSEWLARRGQRVVATRAVPAVHQGTDGKQYRSDHVWGEWDSDHGDDRPADSVGQARSLADRVLAQQDEPEPAGVGF